MGVDLYYCEDCNECVHSDDFRSCVVCYETCKLCDHCDSHLLVDFLNKKHHFVCEPCIIDYKNIDFENSTNFFQKLIAEFILCQCIGEKYKILSCIFQKFGECLDEFMSIQFLVISFRKIKSCSQS